MRFLAERQVAALGSDGNNDTAPSAVADGSDVVGRHYMRHNNLALMAVSRESV